VWCCAVLCCAVLCECRAVSYCTLWCDAALGSALVHGACPWFVALFCAALCHAMLCCGVRRGALLPRVVRCVVVRYGAMAAARSLFCAMLCSAVWCRAVAHCVDWVRVRCGAVPCFAARCCTVMRCGARGGATPQDAVLLCPVLRSAACACAAPYYSLCAVTRGATSLLTVLRCTAPCFQALFSGAVPCAAVPWLRCYAVWCRALLHCSVRYEAVLCCVVRRGAVRCGAVRSGAVLCGTVRCCAVLRCVVPCHAVR
jgi:hypothetical protein